MPALQQPTGRTILTDTNRDLTEILFGVRLLNPADDTDLNADVTISHGSVVSIRPSLGDPSGLWLMPGLVDLHVHLRVPGGEEAETLETGLRAAIAGGVTVVGMMPNTIPPLDSVEGVLRVMEQSEGLGLARIHPVPCVSKGRQGTRCVEMEQFASLGIKAFSDDGSPVLSDSVLLEAFERSSAFSGVVIEHPEVPELAAGGAVNQGLASRITGVAGIPEEAEYRDVARCIEILKRSGTGASLHLTHLSSPQSVRLAIEASAEGLRVTCDVTPHHLALDENDLIWMGSVAKMNPPLRSAESRADLAGLVRSGCVTAVASDHAPHPARRKNLSLQDSAFGITGLETLLPVSMDILYRQEGMPPLEVVRLLTTAPAGILGIPLPVIMQGYPPEMVLFDPDSEWIYERTFSRSSNTPFLGRTLRGRVLRVWVKHEIFREGEFV